MSEQEKKDDIRFMNRPHNWPMWPCCPLKRHIGNGQIECGFLAEGKGPNIFMKNMFTLESGPLSPQLEGVEKKEYPSFEALVADGWECD